MPTFPISFPAFGGSAPPPPPPPVLPAPPGTNRPVVTADQIVSLHTKGGVQLYQFLPEDYADLVWTRDQRDASRCDLALPPLADANRLADIVPWVHWISVWDGERDILLWTGPIQKASANRKGLALSVKDHAAYLMRTRNPITKRWDAADPAWVAEELWKQMADLHNLDTRPLVRADPEGERFDFQVVSDEQMLDQTLVTLVNLGLRWTVVSGTPLLGPLSLDPVTTLSEDDFIGDITLTRDGSEVYNDVVVRGADIWDRQRAAYYGENLQSIVNLDQISGVSNVRSAAQEYLRQVGTVRTRLELPPNTVLSPDAPVSIDQLNPSARFVIEAQGIRQLVELTGVEVTRRAGVCEVKVTMESVEEDIELLDDAAAPNVTLGGEAT